MPAEQPTDPNATALMTSGLGLVGSVLSLIFGGHDLSPWQRVGCVLAGTACAVVFGPLVVLAWPDCPHQVLTAAGFIFGLGGLFIIRALIAWWRVMEARIPQIISRRLDIRDGAGRPTDTLPAVLPSGDQKPIDGKTDQAK